MTGFYSFFFFIKNELIHLEFKIPYVLTTLLLFQSLRQLLNATEDFCPEYLRSGRSINNIHQVLPENPFYIDNAALDL